jgi:PAS domain S-box-containing protein
MLNALGNWLQRAFKLNSISANQLVLSEQLDQLYSTILTSQIASITLAAILTLTYFYHSEVGPWVSIPWFLCIFLVACIRIVLVNNYKLDKLESILDTQKKLNIFRFGVFLSGMVWGASSLVLFVSNAPDHKLFLIFTLAGMAGAGMVTYSADRICTVIYSSIVLIPLSIRLLVIGDNISTAMGLSVVLYFVFLNLNARVINRNIFERIELHLQASDRESKLLSAYEWHQSILDRSMNGFWLLNSNGNFLEVNKTYCQISGYSTEEILKLKVIDLENTDSARKISQHLSKVIELTEDRFETQHLCKDGTLIDVEISIQYRNVNGGCFVVFIQDISKRKASENALQESENKFRALYNSTSDALTLLDIDGYIDCNLSALKLFGCLTKEEFCSYHPADLSPQIQPCGTSSTTLANLYIKKAIKYGKYQFEWTHKRVDSGESFQTEVLLNFIDFNGKQILQANVRDISERKSFEIALIEAKEIAEDANKAKSDFLSSMSHELRTPLNAIIGFAQVLKYDTELNKSQQENIQEIHKAGHHLLTLINEILDLAKIESRQIQIFNEIVGLVPVIEECKNLIQPLASERNIHFHIEVPENISIFIDRTRLKQVLLNLLSNAVKYNSDSGAIKLMAHITNGNNLHISVEDRGAGIPEDQIPSLFQAFNRLDAEHGKIQGTGIGLMITKKIVETMNGTIGCESKLGVGSTFFVDFPISGNSVMTLHGQQVGAV